MLKSSGNPHLFIAKIRLLAIIFFVLILLFLVVRKSYGLNRDFCQNYDAVSRYMRNERVYVPIRCIAASLKNVPFHYNAHPPFSVLLFLPFGYLPAQASTLLWIMVSLAAYILAGVFLLQRMKIYSFYGLMVFIVASYFWSIFIDASVNQNSSQIILFLLAGSWLLQGKKRHVLAGVLLGIASLVKIWPILLLFGVIVARQYKTAVAACMVIFIGVIASLLLLGPREYATYFGEVRAHEYDYIPHTRNISITGSSTRLLSEYAYDNSWKFRINAEKLPRAIQIGEMISIGVIMVTLIFVWWYYPIVRSEGRDLLLYGVLITVAFVAFPISWVWGIVLLPLPLAATVLAIRRLGRCPTWIVILLICSLVILLSPTVFIGFNLSWFIAVNPSLATGLTVLPTFALLLFITGQAMLVLQLRNVKATSRVGK